MKNVFFMSMFSLLLLTSCGGSGSGGGGGKDDGDDYTPQSGVLLDSAVGGVQYRSESETGMTDDSGTYSCKPGEEVEFYLLADSGKEITLGSVTCRAVTTPIELVTQGQFSITTPLANLSANQSAGVVNMLRLLQSLDSDSSPGNGITVSGSDVSILAEELEASYELNVALSSMALDGTFDAKMNTVMSTIGRTLVSESDAIAHFDATVHDQNPGENECEGDECDEEETPPVIDPFATPLECMEGLSLATIGFGSGGITYGASYLIEADGSIQSGVSSSDKVNMRVIIKANNEAEVYRAKKNAQSEWYSFTNAGWETNSDGELTIKSVQFSDENVDIKFGSRINFGGGLMGRYGAETSFGTLVGAAVEEFDRMFRANSCSAPNPATVTPYTQL